MAELHVQPKRNSYWWLWLLLAIIIIGGAVYYYLNYFQKDNARSNNATATDSTSSNQQNKTNSTNVPATANLWSQVNFDSPDTTYTEVTDKEVSAKANAHFVIYSMNDSTLFENSKSELRNDGKKGLKQIAASIDQRFKEGDVRIYNQTDSTRRDQLADARAENVKKYLIKNSKLEENKFSVYKVGEPSSLPTKSNT
ncbi:MAG TPA: OmpA family protein, partial [Hanamia sp.]|nr:OmpA family protein [Hanamia sp.]